MTDQSKEAPLSRLLYTSKQIIGECGTASFDTDAIAADAAGRNAEHGLTGVLLHVDDTFIQVLEGEPDPLEATFERICCDLRHEHVKLIELIPIQERLFDQWDMGCLSKETKTEVHLKESLEDVSFLVGINAREAVNQMRSLLDARTDTAGIPAQ